MSYSTSTKTKRLTMTNGNEDFQLDPELWKKLPEELLETVISKLPFFKLVAFRTVCKSWYSDIVPRAAPHLEASSSSALLYFDFLLEEETEDLPILEETENLHILEVTENLHILDAPYPSAVCLHVRNSKSELSIGSVVHFHQKSFFAPRDGEHVQLLLCEQGLLFLGYIVKRLQMLRDIVVYNPLISKSKTLGVPCPLQRTTSNIVNFIFEYLTRGVVFDTETGSYCLVCSGLDETGDYGTYLYHSTTSEWTNGPSLSQTLKGLGDYNNSRWFPTSERGVSYNGNLYWYACVFDMEGALNGRYVLKFDIQQVTWNLIPDPYVDCVSGGCKDGMASYNGELLLWHLHDDLIAERDGRIPCRFDNNLKLAPEIKSMPHYVLEKIYGVVEQAGVGIDYWDFEYKAVSEGNSIYHVMSRYGVLSILVQDASENSYTELPGVVPGEIDPEAFDSLDLDMVWSFSPSLTSLP